MAVATAVGCSISIFIQENLCACSIKLGYKSIIAIRLGAVAALLIDVVKELEELGRPDFAKDHCKPT